MHGFILVEETKTKTPGKKKTKTKTPEKKRIERMNPSNWQSCGQRKAKPCTHRGMHMEWTILHLFIRDTPINACYDLRQKNKRITCILETTTKIVGLCVCVFLHILIWSVYNSIHIYGGLSFFPLFDFFDSFSFSFWFLLLLELNEWMDEWLKARVSWI